MPTIIVHDREEYIFTTWYCRSLEHSKCAGRGAETNIECGCDCHAGSEITS